MKIKDWLALLPEPISTKAITQTRPGTLNSYSAKCLSDAVGQAFRWTRSKEGGEFWKQVHKNIKILERNTKPRK